MMDKNKVIAITLILVLAVNIALFAMKIINMLLFWLVIGVVALISYKLKPKE